MSKLNSVPLTEEEIEEELVNDDLLNSGGVENTAVLQQMNFEEKKNLLRGIQQSKEDFKNESCNSSTIIIDTSSSDFPPLAAANKNNSRNKLKLPRRQSSGAKPADYDERSNKCISLLDDDDNNESIFPEKKKFSLPFYISNNATPLVMPERAYRPVECPYFQMEGEHSTEALRRMITHHDAWKDKYNAAMSKLESQSLVQNLEDFDSKEPRSDKNGDEENDPYHFPASPVRITKVYSGPKKKETNMNSENVPSPNSRVAQRKTSRDSDCEEVVPIMKPEEPKLGEWMTAARPRNKRNRKQISNQEKNKTYESQTEVEFDFDRSLWRGGSSGGAQSPSSSSLNNQAPARRSIPMPSVPEVQEEKVQCPICQRNFTLSTVENHAATCEGFSSSPMDVEEGT